MFDRYREMGIQTASPVALVARMYEGALRNVHTAREAHGAGRVAERASALKRALAIVAELQHSLDLERGGEIARNLQGLYVFVSERLLEASVRGRNEALDDAQRILETLEGAWRELERRPLAETGGAR